MPAVVYIWFIYSSSSLQRKKSREILKVEKNTLFRRRRKEFSRRL